MMKKGEQEKNVKKKEEGKQGSANALFTSLGEREEERKRGWKKRSEEKQEGNNEKKRK